MEEPAIVVNNISKSFDLNKSRTIYNFVKSRNKSKKLLRVLNGISFTVQRGEILGIIGTNGSGKTTLLRLIAGIYQPDDGFIRVNGKISPLLQLGTGFDGDLNARENIVMNGMLLGISKTEIEKKVDIIIRNAELEKFKNLKLKFFSSGMRARIAFATAVQLEPDILLVDEILSVGDRIFRKKSFEAFLSLKKKKKTILFATHNLEKLTQFSDRVLLIQDGQIVMLGKPEEVIKKYLEIRPSKRFTN